MEVPSPAGLGVGDVNFPRTRLLCDGQRGPYKKDRGPIFFQYGPEQAWLIRDLLYD